MAKASPNFQNPERGRDFATIVRLVFERQGLTLESEFAIDIGAADERRPRKFDLGWCPPAGPDRVQASYLDRRGECAERQDERLERGHVLLLPRPPVAPPDSRGRP